MEAPVATPPQQSEPPVAMATALVGEGQELVSARATPLPKQLDSIGVATSFPGYSQKWNPNEEIASILIAFQQHDAWLSRGIKQRPTSGSMQLYNRNRVRYRKDGYCWKKRKDGKTIREDHMKLKVQGLECIYGSYVHSAILPTFHRRSYWLLQNPDIVLVHYLNVPYPSSAKLSIPIVSFAMEKREWTKDELIDQIRPMFSCGEDRIPAIDDTISKLVQRLIDHQEECYSSQTPDIQPHKPSHHSKPKPQIQPSTDAQHVIQPDTMAAAATAPSLPFNHLDSNHSNHNHMTFAVQDQRQASTSNTDFSQTPLILNFGNVSGSGGLVVVPGQAAMQLSWQLNTPGQQTMSQQVIGNSSDDSIQLDVMGSTQSLSQNYTDMLPSDQQPSGQGHIDLSSVVAHNSQNACTCAQSQHYPDNGSVTNEATSNENNIALPLSGECSHIQNNQNPQIPQRDLSTPLKSDGVKACNSLEGLTLELMSTDKTSPTDSLGKQSMGSIGDSFESLHASLVSLQGSDLNLDQLDLIDLPEFEKICNDLSNNSIINSHESQGGNHSDQNLTCVNNAVSLEQRCGGCEPNRVISDTNTIHGQSVNISTPGSMIPGQKPDQLAPSVYETRASNCCCHHPRKSPNTIAVITDFCPDWAYTEGHTKLLVTGPWHSNTGTYTVLLDSKTMATTLVQPGVLRCFVPCHSPGLVTLQVACDGTIVSNNVVFEYRESGQCVMDSGPQNNWFSVDDVQLRQQLLEKLERIEGELTGSSGYTRLQQQVQTMTVPGDIDSCLSRHVEGLRAQLWRRNDLSVENGAMGLSLLHIGAALGYSTFIQALVQWRNENPSWLLEYEVDAHSQDLNSCSPLMWACARGHTNAAVTLYHWNKGPLNSFNQQGCLPLLVARQHGHHTLADCLEQLELTGSLLSDISGVYSPHTTHTLVPSCSKSLHISRLRSTRSTPDKTDSRSDSPTATSTPIMKDNPASSSDIFKSPKLRSKGNRPLGALHIDIPSSSNAQSFSHRTADKITRRQSEQMLSVAATTSDTHGSGPKLKKRLSVDLLPCDSNQEPVHFSPTSAFQRPIREANSEPHLSSNLSSETNPMLSGVRDMSSPEILMQMETYRGMGTGAGQAPSNMDTDDMSDRSGSPFIDVEKVSSDDEDSLDLRQRIILANGCGDNDDPKNQMVHLAKQIIAAMPERIKSSPSRGDDMVPDHLERERSSSYSSLQSVSPRASSSYGEDSGISTPMRDSLTFDEYRYSDRYSDLGTPASSLSPDSTCLHSPYSPYSFHMDSPPPTTAEFMDYFNAPATFLEKDFSQLTLSDREQRKLYEAAKVIQNAYRSYLKKQFQQQRKEIEAAVLIQSYYRRYKQYAYYKKMTQAAVLIQSQFRSYYAQKRYKKSRDAAVVIQNQYRSYKEHERLKKGGNKSVIQRYRSHYQRKLAGAGKGSRVVQIVPESVDGSQPEANTAIEESAQETSQEGAPPTEQEREATPGIEPEGK